MNPIKDNLERIEQQITQTAVSCGRNPEDIQLIAVSKKKSSDMIQQAALAGAVHFGENYIQEAVQKVEKISDDRLMWHFIGHLQSNKARFAVKHFEYIHTVDTIKLAREISKQAKKIDKVQKVLIQVNIGEESSKSGTQAEDTLDLAKEMQHLENISVQGLMCMPPWFTDPEDARPYFQKLVAIKDTIAARQMETVSMTHLSMGMSNDFKVAIEEGATFIRVGTSIFGERF